ncbi:hypothetical protein ACDW_43360 (plasmid) [Acidovorax sp. DW039]|uniref:hypothetical protein n=1 Tax=Acidovorax sp. DW039 TaxID=3095606 RepID=UPI003093DFF1|nr:hypothetical protein ACDW_12510 [Acidovorax sp. DW039]BEU98630.1 hypothetical protein ACDW_43360 [Acidovorax sp. DW039]
MNISAGTDTAKSPRWSVELTKELVTEVFGKEQWAKAFPSVRAVTDRPAFCGYHYHEALDMMNKYVNSNMKDVGLFSIFGNSDEFNELMLQISANVVAFVQSLHALTDCCSHMLYHTLALEKHPSPLKERDINAAQVLKRLKPNSNTEDLEHGKLYTLFKQMTTGEDYRYLCALSNTLKHRSMILPQLNQDTTGTRQEKWILFLEPFKYMGSSFDRTNVREFMRKEHDRIQPLTVDIGVQMNETLKRLRR